MLSDVALGGHAARGNTLGGQRGSRYMSGILQAHTGTLSLDSCGMPCRYRAGSITGAARGVCRPVLKLQLFQEGLSGKVDMAANRTREIRPSGMRGRLRGNVGYGRTRIPPHRLKECGSVTLALRPSAPRFYPTTGKFNDLDGKCAGGRR